MCGRLLVEQSSELSHVMSRRRKTFWRSKRNSHKTFLGYLLICLGIADDKIGRTIGVSALLLGSFKIARSQAGVGHLHCAPQSLFDQDVPQASPGHGQREKANSDVKLFVRVKCGLAPPVCCFHPNDSCDNSNLFFQARADE